MRTGTSPNYNHFKEQDQNKTLLEQYISHWAEKAEDNESEIGDIEGGNFVEDMVASSLEQVDPGIAEEYKNFLLSYKKIQLETETERDSQFPNKENISGLSNIIDKHKESKSEMISMSSRSNRPLSKESVAKVINDSRAEAAPAPRATTYSSGQKDHVMKLFLGD